MTDKMVFNNTIGQSNETVQLTVRHSLKQHIKNWAVRLLSRRGKFATSALEVPGIPGRVHKNDTMFDPNDLKGIEYYVRAGVSASEVIGRTLRGAEVPPTAIGSVLDYGCGYGRVLRHLPELLPAAKLVACDLDPRAVDFCSREFGAKGIVAPEKPSRLRLPSFDLIWGGSVWTHLPENEGRQLFSALSGSLNPNGILVFSFHGAFAYDNLHSLFGAAYAGEATQIQAEIVSHGVSYRSYPNRYLTLHKGLYGTAWHSPDYYRSLAREGGGLREVFSATQGWDRFHDVIAFQHRPPDDSNAD